MHLRMEDEQVIKMFETYIIGLWVIIIGLLITATSLCKQFAVRGNDFRWYYVGIFITIIGVAIVIITS